jgi:peptidoglycan/xylan/chitin deacetylase (PgdA/CDA1 family)
MAVSPRHFAEHMEVVRRYGRAMHLLDLALAHQRGQIPPQAVVVTFDDGYLDNLQNAKPLLAQYDVPATVFVTTGKIGRGREFWWDELDQVLLQPNRLPETLQLKVNGRSHQWKLDGAAVYGESDRQRQGKRKAWDGESGSRLAFYYDIYRVLQPLPAGIRQEALGYIAAWAGVELAERQTHRTISVGELHALADGALVDIGAHTVTHPFLSAHNRAYQQREIQESKHYLENELGRPIKSFAYPHGDYNSETVSLIQGDFFCACTTKEDNVWRRSHRFQLPRFEVQDWDGEAFARRLQGWLEM